MSSSIQPANNDTTRYDSQIGRQGTVTTEFSEDRKIISNQDQKNLSNQIIATGLIQIDPPRLCYMIGNMDNQAKKSVHKILPSSRCPIEATLQKLAIEI